MTAPAPTRPASTGVQGTGGDMRRLHALDALRGVALVMMVGYHFAWDLSWFGLLRVDVGSAPTWRAYAEVTAGLFLLLVGTSLVLAARRPIATRAFARAYVRRLVLLIVCSGLITLATWRLFPDSYIFFGVLHEIAVASVLALPFVRAPLVLTGLAAATVLALPHLARFTLMDAPWLIWLGLGTYTPVSNDFVPLFPWFGVTLAGVVAGRVLLASPGAVAFAARAPRRRAGRALVLGGRHTLLIYMLHQPLLYGSVWGVATLAGISTPTAPDPQAAFMRYCMADCIAAGGFTGMCKDTCHCASGRLAARGLRERLVAGDNDPRVLASARRIVAQCRPH